MKIAILAGETSGDNYGALLAKEIRKSAPNTLLFGTGGRAMKEQMDFLIEGLPCGKMGFSGILTSLPLFYRSYKQVKKIIRKEKTSLVVLIDNPGFNLKIAKALGKEVPCFYYIPPKIWAHNYGRIRTIKEYVKGVISIFPFEERLYKREGIPCKWFGHPATDLFSAPTIQEDNGRFDTTDTHPVVGILPGSREEEITNLLPPFIRLLRRLREKRQVEVLLSASDNRVRRLQERILREERKDIRIIEGNPHPLIEKSSILLAASGTINLEAALMGKPLIVFYKTSALNYLLAQIMVKLKVVSPVNLLQDEMVVPEYIQRFPYGQIVEQVFEIMDRGPLYRKEMDGFMKIKEKVGEGDVSAKTAAFLLEQTGIKGNDYR